MNDKMLSQEEIDALLNGTGNMEVDSDNESESENLQVEQHLSSIEIDALGEIGNISFGSSATALSTLLNQKVDITTPSVSIIRKDRLVDEFPKPYVAISVDYTTGFIGSNLLVINQADASIIADLMLGGTGVDVNPDIGELQLSAVQEAMNQMMGNAATSMSTIFQKRVEISPPLIDILNIPNNEGLDVLPPEDFLVKISFRLIVGKLINSNIMQLVPISFAKQLVHDLMNPNEAEAASAVLESDVTEALEDSNYTTPFSTTNEMNHNSYNYENQIKHEQVYTNYEKQHITEPNYSNQNVPTKPVQPAVFSEFTVQEPVFSEPRNLNMLYDIPLSVTVELGRTTKLVKDILGLTPGSIIELDKLAGEPVDILVNNKLIAKGEVVVIEENFGVRITDIVSQTERIKNMK